MDTLSKEQRSALMAKVRGKHTKPEIAVQRIIRRAGFHGARHVKSLPGSPDFAFKSEKKAIFVHGCFWHRHRTCNGDRIPKSRVGFWVNKLDTNRRRDTRNQRRLHRMGWRYIIVWECRLKRPTKVEKRIIKFLEESP